MFSGTAGEWNARIVAQGGSFLQAFEWGVFQEAAGHPVMRCIVGDLAAQAFRHSLPLGSSYFYVPRGPVGAFSKHEFARWFGSFREEIAEDRPIFLRIDPPYADRPSIAAALRSLGFLDIGRAIQPRENLIVNLREERAAILAAMYGKTRYNIRVAERHGVTVHSGTPDVLLALLRETAARQRIRLHSERYYRLMVEMIPELPASSVSVPSENLYRRLYVASLSGEALASALVLYFGNRASYVHGGSTLRHRHVMAAYALHWRIMEEAKAVGFREYDFGGVDDRRWPGLTRFKTGFGGRRERYQNAFDYPLLPFRYRLYRIGRRLLR